MRLFLLAAMAAVLPWSGTALAENLSTSAPSADIETPTEPLPPEARPMESQGDPAWRWMKLGSTTIGKAGCLVTSLYDTLITDKLLSASTDLGAFVRLLSSYGLFTPGGDLRWDLKRLFPMLTIERMSAFGGAAIQKAAYALSQGAQVLIQVATNHGTRHWVVVSRIVNGDALIRDPNGGRIRWLSASYGTQAIRGMATIAMAQ